MAADGSITFSTALDNDQLEKDLKKAERDVESLKRKLAKADRDKGAIEQEMERAREAVRETSQELDTLRGKLGIESDAQLATDLSKATKEASALERAIDSVEKKQEAVARQMDEAAASYEEASQRASELRAEADGLDANTDPADMQAWHEAHSQAQAMREEADQIEAGLSKQEAKIDSLNDKWQELDAQAKEYRDQLATAAQTRDDLGGKSAQISQANDRLKEQERELSKIETRWETANRKVETYNRDLEAAGGRASELGEAYGEAMAGSNSATTRAAETMRGAFDQMGKRINTMIKRVFVLQVALSALRGLRSMISEALMENDRFSASVAALKASFQGVVNYVANAVAPAITSMVNVAASAIINLAKLIDSLFGTSIMKSIASARKAAQAAWRETDASKAAAKAAEKQAKATKKLAKETDKATKSVMGFDEINALSADDSTTAADSLADDAAGIAGDGLKPDWDALDVGKISAKLEEIMLILGAALMVVGAILAFSGINIPLGITLMMVGALMVYTAYQDRWDELPQKLRDVITGCLVVAGIVAVVLGAVLAFSGINIPLGIGLMAAGLVLLGIAAALNWATLGDTLRAAITTTLVVVGAVALTLGAVLAFSGANVPLGIGLMALGALAIATAGTLNWEALKGNLRQAVSSALEIIGIIAVVLGAVLAFTGTNIPLGVGIMALGAAAMFASAALNWSQLGGTLSGALSKALRIVGIIAVVIGAVLAFTSANVPLGVALMAAGAAAVFASAALNWSKLKDKVSAALSTMLTLAGAVALAIGAVIALSGVNLPLGIALIAAGALALVASAALSWDKVPQQVRTTVGIIAGIASAALLVLGIILCLSGFGIPLGIALIAAGAAGLVTAAAVNWDFLKQKVGEVWDGIVSWWKSGPGKIFTADWWENKFKSIADGLRAALNSVLPSVSSFISSVSSSISSVASSLSRLSSYRSTGTYRYGTYSGFSTNIPHLAQGAVLPPNREFMAVLGDQRHGNNFEAPEGLMRQVVREETGAMMAELVRQLATMGPASAQPARSQGDLVLVVDGRELARASMRGTMDLQATGELGLDLPIRYA